MVTFTGKLFCECPQAAGEIHFWCWGIRAMSCGRERDVRTLPGAGTGPASRLLDRASTFFGVGGRRAVFARQAPLSVTVALVVIAAAAFYPDTLAARSFQISLLVHAALFVASIAAPWDRLPPGASAAVPVLDCVAIGFTREAGGPSFNALSLLLVFPVIWLSVDRYRTGVFLAVAASVTSTVVPALVLNPGTTEQSMIRTIFLPLVMTLIAATAHVVARMLDHQRRTLVRKDEALARSAAESIRRQQLLEAVLSTVNVGVWVVDDEGQVLLTNSVLEADPALSCLVPGHRPGLFLSDGTTAVSQEDSPASRAAAGDVFTDELYWAGEGETRKAYSVTARSMRSHDGARAGAVVTFADVSALIRALAAKDDFVATVSHELRTPLTAILGYVELILDEPGHEDIEPELRVVERSAVRLLALVNDLLTAASEQVGLTLEETDVASVLAGVVTSCRPKAAVNGVDIVLDADQPLIARVDPARIRQMFSHLISNSITFSPDGGTIIARARRENGSLVCSIADNGMGMSKQEQGQVFTKLFRSERARETAIPGAGLGLPISKAIAEGHGGSIGLESTPDSGTTVTVSIPL